MHRNALRGEKDTGKEKIDFFHIFDLGLLLTHEDKLTLIAQMNELEKNFTAENQKIIAAVERMSQKLTEGGKTLEAMLLYLADVKRLLLSETEGRATGDA